MELLPERNLLLEIIVDHYDQHNLTTDKSNDETYEKEGIGEAKKCMS
jgi:hypothetical protein